MSYTTSGYLGGHREAERVAAMLRSLMQDATRDFKTETIDILFPVKIVDEVDIGKVSSKWVKNILCALKNDSEIQIKLIMIIWCNYNNGVNVDKDPAWHLTWMRIGLPLFSDKINDLPAVGKVAPMGSLEKPEKNIEPTKWWRQ